MSDNNTLGYAIYDPSLSLLVAGTDGGYFYDTEKAAQKQKDNMSGEPSSLEIVEVNRIEQ